MMSSPRRLRYSLSADVFYTLGAGAVCLLLFAVARGLLLFYNRDLIGDIPAASLLMSFAVGFRFDLIFTCYVLTPMILAFFFPAGLSARRAWNVWVGFWLLVFSFLAVLELDFYREFHTRLNSLVFQYMKEDPQTVVSMLWYGFPVVRLLLLCSVLTIVAWHLLRKVDRGTRQAATIPTSSYRARLGLALVLTLATVACARGTFRSGPPLRWGDAFHSQSLFANHLALNGAFTLAKAAQQALGRTEENPWVKHMPKDEALAIVRKEWLQSGDTLLAPDEFPLLRRVDPPADAPPSPYKNVVVVLMESFSAQRVGVFGNPLNITPNFDALSGEGLLFNHIFSNGTHTHQGMFATFGCFPNLPHYEYLMQQPEGSHHFSGLPKVLSARDYDNVFVYNGDFAWDNQGGFFRAQGLQHFVGRHDFVNPRFSDPTWGVSDEDMYDRAFEEIVKLKQNGRPFYAMLQTLSNHTPYALPDPLPVQEVMVDGVEQEHLTAMRYADYALGQFFKKIKAQGGFDDTLFVLVGDHGFGGSTQVTDMDLIRFHVPLLVWGKDIQQRFGKLRTVVGSQVDVVPTIMGLIGGSYTQHCWGRDLLALAPDDPGIAVIKPSGSEQIVALVQGDYLLTQLPGSPSHLTRFGLQPLSESEISDPGRQQRMEKVLEAFLQTALGALLDNRTGHNDELKQ